MPEVTTYSAVLIVQQNGVSYQLFLEMKEGQVQSTEAHHFHKRCTSAVRKLLSSPPKGVLRGIHFDD